jgi:hypothetical protein
MHGTPAFDFIESPCFRLDMTPYSGNLRSGIEIELLGGGSLRWLSSKTAIADH